MWWQHINNQRSVTSNPDLRYSNNSLRKIRSRSTNTTREIYTKQLPTLRNIYLQLIIPFVLITCLPTANHSAGTAHMSSENCQKMRSAVRNILQPIYRLVMLDLWVWCVWPQLNHWESRMKNNKTWWWWYCTLVKHLDHHSHRSRHFFSRY